MIGRVHAVSAGIVHLTRRAAHMLCELTDTLHHVLEDRVIRIRPAHHHPAALLHEDPLRVGWFGPYCS